ncbi:MAG: RNA polymerase factor sigma-54, partial [Deltaproteobacteria bacterium]
IMAYELKQELRLSQKLLLTPQLQLSIKLLQLSRAELQELVREELLSNPVLEDTAPAEGHSEEDSPIEGKEAKPEQEWQEYLEVHDPYMGRRLDFSEASEDGFFEKAPSPGITLKDHLMLQLQYLPLDERDKKIAEFVIGNIDEHGFLRVMERGDMSDEAFMSATVNELSALIGVSAEDVTAAIAEVQGFDPPGVGARTSTECLLIQARVLAEGNNPLVEGIISGHLENLAKKNYKAIAKDLGRTVEAVVEAANFITGRLNPVPGAGFGTEEARVVVPDLFIQKIGDEYVVFLNDDGLPKLNISPYYKKMLFSKGTVEGDAKGYIQERLRAAVWLIKSVHQRQRTLKKVAESILRFQREFFDSGLKYLKPIILKDVAQDIEMHESTVSRVTTNKYAHTPRGMFELKYFFSTGMSQSDGSHTTAEYIKERLKSVIEGEDSENPLSDQQIAEKLKEARIILARRTVAKYREELGFLSSSARKSHY